ncbi:EF-P lysine aminoacylase GenX [Candidatus Microgenomates bacterium]|jgi:lysyl-tRNA synthetase class 2|nr:MAG: EF-P lysine aminoacylase GenX [Candidatus Microgenomates bacterium]
MRPIWEKLKNDPLLREKIYTKAKILKLIREFFDKEGFLEVDSPTLVTSPDPSPFNEVYEIKDQEQRIFLTPSPEFLLKKMLVAGFENIFQITKAYRDQNEQDPLHLKEFNILEWYRTGGNYKNLMDDCENLVRFIKNGLKKDRIFYQGEEVDVNSPWLRISCKEAFKKYAGVDLDEFLDPKKAEQICQKKGYLTENSSWEELYHQIFLNEVEKELLKSPALILYDYPAPLAALSKIKEKDKKYAERMEFYLAGIELGNGYSELTDWKEQEKRLRSDLEERKRKKMKVFEPDRDFIEALKEGMSETSGIAVGIDRLIMLFTDSKDIRETNPFCL